MTITLPIVVKNKGLKENQLILIALLHKLRLMYGNEWYTLYKYDIGTILQDNRSSPYPLYMFNGLSHVLRVRYSSDYKMDLKVKNWSPEEFEYTIKDFRNVVVWSILLDNNNYAETSRNEPSKGVKQSSTPSKRHIAAAINIHYLEYDRSRLGNE